MADITKEVQININTKEAVAALNKLSESLEETTKDTEEAQEATSDYADDLTIFGTNIGGLRRQFSSAVGGAKNFIASLKTLRGAIIATGIGALLIALTSLGALLKTSQGAMNAFNDALAVIGSTVNVLINRFAKLGSAFIKIIQLDFSGAMEDASAAVSGLSAEIRDAANATLEFEERQRGLDDQLRINRLGNAQDERRIKELVLLSRDRTKSAEERQKAIIEADQLQRQVNERNINAEKDAQTLLKDRLTLQAQSRALTDAEKDSLIEAELLVQSAIATGADRQRDLVNRRFELEGQVSQERQDQARFNARAEVDIEVEKQGLIQEEVKLTGIVIDETLKDNTENYEKAAKLQTQIEKEKNEAILSSTSDLFGGIARLAGQNSLLGKAAAIAQATINTFQGATKALAEIVFPANIIASAAVIANGLASVRQIVSTPLPKVEVQATPFAKGGLVHGRSHAQGGEKFAVGGRVVELEGGEAVINKRSTRLFKPLLSALNQATGGAKFAAGGITPTLSLDPVIQAQQFEDLNRAIRTQQPVLVVEDVSNLQQQINVVEDRADLG